MNNHIKRVIAAALCLILAIPAFTVASSAEGDLPFIDVKKSEWYYDPFLYVY